MLPDPLTEQKTIQEQFVGTWKLVLFQRWLNAREYIYPWGTQIDGRLIYTADGFLSVQQMKLNRRTFLSDKNYIRAPEEAENAFDTYVAYTGRYSIHEDEAAVYHIADASLFPNWTGKALKRFYKFTGNRLTLVSHQVPVVDAVQLTWERLSL